MKNVLMTLTFACLLFTTSNAYGQNYGKFAVDLGAKYSLLTGDYSGGGVGFFLEPQAMIKDNLGIGIRMGFDLLNGATTSDQGNTINGGIDLLSSYQVTGNYFFKKTGNKRGFAGLGLGFANQGGVSFEGIGSSTVDGDVELGTVFGFSPRVGFDLGAFKIYADYNQYFKKGAKSYIGLNLALNFGGKYKG